MKYIRTNDGIYEVEEWFKPLENDMVYIPNEGLNKILKQADTIEELCDEFVVYDSEQNKGLPITCPKERLFEIKPYIMIGIQKGFECWLKGAIWTDRGLTYIAKMNDKGDLELL